MKAHYLIEIESPEQNTVKVRLTLPRPEGKSALRVFLPSWSPGSYMMREYARHVRWLRAEQENGETLMHTQLAKGVWEIDWGASQLKTPTKTFTVTYVIYLFELTVRTSHVTASHAFLHGPSYLMGVVGEELPNPSIEFRFPPLWSRLSTSLKDISPERGRFLYTAANYDELVDCPVEIGCHETDGFTALGKPHHLAFWGADELPANLKEDMRLVVETTAAHFGNELPYDQYLFITHFAPGIRGGLEHLNSTALQFDGRKLGNRKDYLSYLSLVAHEYFHLWNVKRIRPRELGPFDYLTENYTSMLWLAEGLTSFMDDLLVYRAGLCSLEEYLDFVRQNLDQYLSTPGRKFHSLEQSSFNAWIKLYRPDENSRNSSVSYYLKGGLVFNVLHSLLVEKGKSIDHLLRALWEQFKARPHQGVERDEVYGLIRDIGGEATLAAFSTLVETTEEADFEACFRRLGCELVWQEPKTPWLGVTWEYQGERVLVKTVLLDSPGYRAGLNPGDEVLALRGLRVIREDLSDLISTLALDRPVPVLVSRLGRLQELELTPGKSPRTLKEIAVTNRALAEKAFSFSGMPAPAGIPAPL